MTTGAACHPRSLGTSELRRHKPGGWFLLHDFAFLCDFCVLSRPFQILVTVSRSPFLRGNSGFSLRPRCARSLRLVPLPGRFVSAFSSLRPAPPAPSPGLVTLLPSWQ